MSGIGIKARMAERDGREGRRGITEAKRGRGGGAVSAIQPARKNGSPAACCCPIHSRYVFGSRLTTRAYNHPCSSAAPSCRWGRRKRMQPHGPQHAVLCRAAGLEEDGGRSGDCERALHRRYRQGEVTDSRRSICFCFFVGKLCEFCSAGRLCAASPQAAPGA